MKRLTAFKCYSISRQNLQFLLMKNVPFLSHLIIPKPIQNPSLFHSILCFVKQAHSTNESNCNHYVHGSMHLIYVNNVYACKHNNTVRIIFMHILLCIAARQILHYTAITFHKLFSGYTLINTFQLLIVFSVFFIIFSHPKLCTTF